MLIVVGLVMLVAMNFRGLRKTAFAGNFWRKFLRGRPRPFEQKFITYCYIITICYIIVLYVLNIQNVRNVANVANAKTTINGVKHRQKQLCMVFYTVLNWDTTAHYKHHLTRQVKSGYFGMLSITVR